MNEFERVLQRVCEEDPEYDVLWAQWIYDKRLIARALQNVGGLFPHYSLHDASHSITILRQLARVLGSERIEQLSPTDLWLLLEAAYLHDIGMVVSDAQKKAWWRDEAFKAHLSRLASSADGELRSAAELLSSKLGLEELGDEWPFGVERALVLVMADYARGQHPRMAEQIIGQPGLIGLESPRTKLIPHRAIQLLGKICRHHGSSFEKMLELPARESGYGTDEAHPRFVACMLRLGDLLDLDDGRFCPVLMKTFGPLPPSSQAHERKHASIERLLVSPTRIEVEAVCEDVGAFDEAERWLSWLRDELRDQAARWADIVPTDSFGALPGTGNITARLKGYLTFEDGRRPRFEVDREAMINMVRGANLYEHPVSFIRELLQNAADATLLRVWGECRGEILSWERDVKMHDGILSNLRKLLVNYPIRVEISPEQSSDDATSGSGRVVRVSIDDQGMGIDREDLRYLQSVGGSRNNQRRLKRKVEMPEWMRPSGIFGIGLQSAFLFTNKLVLTTRADDGPETFRITLYRGAKGSAGQILVELLSGQDVRKTPGTRIECEIPVSHIPETVPGSVIGGSGEARFVISEFDGVTDSGLAYEGAAARDEVRAFAKESLCTIFLGQESLDGLRSRGQSAIGQGDRPRNSYFDRRTCVEFKDLTASESSHFEVLYRGVKTDEREVTKLLGGQVDFHFGQADELLLLNRERLRGDAKGEVREKVNSAVNRVFPRYYKDLLSLKAAGRVDQEELWAASLFAELNGNKCEPQQTSEGAWRDAPWVPGITLGDVADADVVEIVEPTTVNAFMYRVRPARTTSEDGRKRVVIYEHGRVSTGLWLVELASKNRKAMFLVRNECVFEEEKVASPCRVYRFVRAGANAEEIDPVEGVAALRWILGHIRIAHGVGHRCVMPCPPSFALLRVSEVPPYARVLEYSILPRMVCPFSAKNGKIVAPNLADVVRWTVRHTDNPQVRELLGVDAAKAHVVVANELLRFMFRAHEVMAAPGKAKEERGQGEKSPQEGSWSDELGKGWEDRQAYDLRDAVFELRKAFGSAVAGPQSTDA